MDKTAWQVRCARCDQVGESTEYRYLEGTGGEWLCPYCYEELAAKAAQLTEGQDDGTQGEKA